MSATAGGTFDVPTTTVSDAGGNASVMALETFNPSLVVEASHVAI
jgi:hypothetical protein